MLTYAYLYLTYFLQVSLGLLLKKRDCWTIYRLNRSVASDCKSFSYKSLKANSSSVSVRKDGCSASWISASSNSIRFLLSKNSFHLVKLMNNVFFLVVRYAFLTWSLVSQILLGILIISSMNSFACVKLSLLSLHQFLQ